VQQKTNSISDDAKMVILQSKHRNSTTAGLSKKIGSFIWH